MAVDFQIIDRTSVSFGLNDILAVTEARGTYTLPLTGTFRVVRITDLSLAQVLKYQNVHMDTTDPENAVMTMAREWALDPAKMTTQQRNGWNTNRYIETTFQTARKWVKNKVTGQYEG